jgi:hypothetical protein
MQRTLRARMVGVLGVLALVVGMSIAFTGVASASTTDWNQETHNGTNADGECSTVIQDPTVAPGTQVWHFVLTTPDAGPWELTANFTDSGTKTDAGEQQGNGNGAVSFFVSTSVGDTLESASSTNGGNVLTVSDCRVNTETASLVVQKTVTGVSDNNRSVVPTSFTADVVCSDGTSETVTMNWDGVNDSTAVGTPTVTGIVPGSTCTVTENTESNPDLTDVTYDPANADTVPVHLDEVDTVTVTITNDFSDVEVSPAEVVTPPVQPVAPAAAAVQAAARFTG